MNAACRRVSLVPVGLLPRVVSWALLFSFALFVGRVTGQENEAAAPLPPNSPVENAAEPMPPQPVVAPAAARKKKKASAGIAAIIGIAMLGVGAIAFTMIWARRLRRFARDPGPTQTTLGNDFWFLKPPKVIAADSKNEGNPTPLPPETLE